LVSASVACLLFLAACAPAGPSTGGAPSGQAPTSAQGAQTAPAQGSEWDRAVAAAKQEGRVVVMGPQGDQIRQYMLDGFKKAYPDITLEWQGGRNNEMAVKLEQERRGGIYSTDVFLGGTSTALLMLKPVGAIDPIKPALLLPEVTDPKNWLDNRLDFADKDELNFVFVNVPSTPAMYNPQAVRADELDEMHELVDPKWRGRLVINDPIPTGAGNVAFRFFWEVLGPQRAEEYMRTLKANAAAVTQDQRQQVEWLVRNRYPIVVGASALSQQQLVDIRDQVQMLTQFKDYGGLVTASSGSVVMVNNAPHPNAAKVYLNWLLGKDGQTAWSTALNQPSRRVDVARDHLPPELVPKPGEKYWQSYTQENVVRVEAFDNLLKELFSQ
jgi:ABC-type Fe3+ transport system substrate-binding protein